VREHKVTRVVVGECERGAVVVRGRVDEDVLGGADAEEEVVYGL
jgi:hypothetical protein